MPELSSSRVIALLLDKWMADEEPPIVPGDMLEVALKNFSGDMSTVPQDTILQISALANLRFGAPRGIPPRSYRVHVISISAANHDDVLLHVAEAERGLQESSAIAVPRA